MTGAARSQPTAEPVRRCKHDVGEDCPACAEETIAGLKERVKELETEDYLVWSNQHRAWWRPNSCGYTTNICAAGRYSRDEAVSISGQSRDGWGKPSDLPEELAIPVSALPKNIRAALLPGTPAVSR